MIFRLRHYIISLPLCVDVMHTWFGLVNNLAIAHAHISQKEKKTNQYKQIVCIFACARVFRYVWSTWIHFKCSVKGKYYLKFNTPWHLHRIECVFQNESNQINLCEYEMRTQTQKKNWSSEERHTFCVLFVYFQFVCLDFYEYILRVCISDWTVYSICSAYSSMGFVWRWWSRYIIFVGVDAVVSIVHAWICMHVKSVQENLDLQQSKRYISV